MHKHYVAKVQRSMRVPPPGGDVHTWAHSVSHYFVLIFRLKKSPLMWIY